MRFLLNINVSRTLGDALAHLGQQWTHARDMGLAKADDQVIVDTARQGRLVIVTHDLDYGEPLDRVDFGLDRAENPLLF